MGPTGRGFFDPSFRPPKPPRPGDEHPQHGDFLLAMLHRDENRIEGWIGNCFWSQERVDLRFPALLSLAQGRFDLAQRFVNMGLHLSPDDAAFAAQKLCPGQQNVPEPFARFLRRNHLEPGRGQADAGEKAFAKDMARAVLQMQSRADDITTLLDRLGFHPAQRDKDAPALQPRDKTEAQNFCKAHGARMTQAPEKTLQTDAWLLHHGYFDSPHFNQEMLEKMAQQTSALRSGKKLTLTFNSIVAARAAKAHGIKKFLSPEKVDALMMAIETKRHLLQPEETRALCQYLYTLHRVGHNGPPDRILRHLQTVKDSGITTCVISPETFLKDGDYRFCRMLLETGWLQARDFKAKALLDNPLSAKNESNSAFALQVLLETLVPEKYAGRSGMENDFYFIAFLQEWMTNRLFVEQLATLNVSAVHMVLQQQPETKKPKPPSR